MSLAPVAFDGPLFLPSLHLSTPLFSVGSLTYLFWSFALIASKLELPDDPKDLKVDFGWLAGCLALTLASRQLGAKPGPYQSYKGEVGD